MHTYLESWRKYATFSGRSRRSEYWTFQLVNFAICMLILVAFLIGLFLNPSSNFFFDFLTAFLIANLFVLAILIPNFAVCVRRLHDVGKSGWWVLISLIPIIGSIVFLIFTLMDSQLGENKYGPNLKEGSGGVLPPQPSSSPDLSSL